MWSALDLLLWDDAPSLFVPPDHLVVVPQRVHTIVVGGTVMDLQKFRGEADNYAFDFAAETDGDVINSAEILVELGAATAYLDGAYRPAGPWTDVSAQFVSEVLVAGTEVQFGLSVAAEGMQLAGSYRVVAKAITAGGRTLEAIAYLRIDDD